MSESMLSFVLSQLPEEWDYIPEYSKSFHLFPVSKYKYEYQKVESYFYGAQINKIQRVQNPFQYGRYMLRREMLQTTYENTVLHYVHKDDLETALKFNCDYRRYVKRRDGVYKNGNHPQFYDSFKDLLNQTKYPLNSITFLVLKILTNKPQTQCDYYVEYVVTIF